MRPGTRPALALGLTAVGLAATLRFHTPPLRPLASARPPSASALPAVGGSPLTRPRAQVASPASPGAHPTIVVKTVAPSSRAVTPPPTEHTSSRPTPRPSTSAGSQPMRSYVCQTFQAGSYGSVQVAIKVQGSHWLDVVNLQLPSGDSQTDSISASAGPQLRREALKAENANIDNVSGATYTTYAYRQSLQSCIDQW